MSNQGNGGNYPSQTGNPSGGGRGNRPLGPDWLAELGPVKFLIRGETSRS